MSNSRQPVLSVILPVFNEVQTVDQLLRRVAAQGYDKEIIVVDDGSTDGTSDVLQRWATNSKLTIMRHSENFGKGASIVTGLQLATGTYVIIQDADLEYAPEDYQRLIEPLRAGTSQVVYGSRYLDHAAVRGQPLVCRLGVSILNRVTRAIYGVRLTDCATCYKVMPTPLLKSLDLECRRFEFCEEVTAKLARMEIPITEVPISYQPRCKAQGKKIRWRDGVEAMWTLWRFRKWKPAG